MITKKIKQRTWLFSGVSSGLGREWARFLLAQGDRVVGITRDTSSVKEFLSDDDNQFIPVEADITDMASLEKSVDSALKRNGLSSITHVVCSAAFAHFGTVEDVSPSELEESFRVNVIGSRNVAIVGLKNMAASGDRRILFVSSMAGLHCWPNLGSYQISKFGVRALSDTLRKELATQGIQVGCLYPGPHSGTGWATDYAVHTNASSRYDSNWLSKSCRCGFELSDPEGSLPSFKKMISQTPMPAAATTHREVVEMFEVDARDVAQQLRKIGE